MPGEQGVAAVLPVGLAYPGSTSAHASAEMAPRVVPILPAWHGVGVLLPMRQKEPAGQSSQLALMKFGAYLPAGHDVQITLPALDACVPGLQLVGAVLPAAHALPSGHNSQSASLTSPGELEKRPGGQGSGEEEPSAQYEPAAAREGGAVFHTDRKKGRGRDPHLRGSRALRRSSPSDNIGLPGTCSCRAPTSDTGPRPTLGCQGRTCGAPAHTARGLTSAVHCGCLRVGAV